MLLTESAPGGNISEIIVCSIIIVKHTGMTKTSIRTHLGLMAVFIASFGCVYLLPINQLFKSIATTPAIAALVAVIYLASEASNLVMGYILLVDGSRTAH